VARVLRRYDLGHSHALFGHLEAAVAGRIARRPVLLHLHDIVQPGAGRKLLDRAVALSTASYAITAAVKDCVSESLHHKVDVQHHGVDLERFRPAPAAEEVRKELGCKQGDLLVGILGRIDRRKGVDLLVDAVDSLNGVRVAVIGAPHLESAEYASELEAQVADRGLNVGFYAPRGDVERVMQSLDVLVNASVAEPFGMTIVEAMACGTAVIAIKSGGVPEFVTDGQEGVLLEERSPAALRTAICAMRDNPGLRLDMAAAGRRRAERDHDLNLQVAQIAEKYRELTAAPDDGL
jgi:glycosyltransferase involved in cell wall biosynthesis